MKNQVTQADQVRRALVAADLWDENDERDLTVDRQAAMEFVSAWQRLFKLARPNTNIPNKMRVS